jgi:hypothetical protein
MGMCAHKPWNDDLALTIKDSVGTFFVGGFSTEDPLDPVTFYEEIRAIQDLLARVHAYNGAVF